jgi:hypothetical protein
VSDNHIPPSRVEPSVRTPSQLETFLGGSPAQVMLRLAVISLIVGFLLAALDLTPFALVRWVRDAFDRILEMGFYAFHDVLRWVGLGAVIVLPIWLLTRLLAARKG